MFFVPVGAPLFPQPCRCGYLADPALACSRAPKCAYEYQAKISGPLFDCIDLHVDVPAISPADLTLPPPAEGSADVRARVAAARERYRALNEKHDGGKRRLRTNLRTRKWRFSVGFLSVVSRFRVDLVRNEVCDYAPSA